MSEIHYTVLWIPTIFHGHITSLIEKRNNLKEIGDDLNLDNVEISDGVGRNFCYLDLTLKKAKDDTYPTKRDIWIHVRNVERISQHNEPADQILWIGNRETRNPDYINNVDRLLKLECASVSRNGLVQFCYEIPDDFNPAKQTHPLIDKNKKITHAVYHAIKDIFHEHIFHKTEKDSIINPYTNEKEIDIKSDDNPALLYYLGQFETILADSIDQINSIANRITEFRSVDKGEGLHQALILSQDLLERCVKALGFGVYYQALCYSKYNLSFKKESFPGKAKPDISKEKEYYQCAINIENSLNYIRVIEAQYRNFFKVVSTFTYLDNQSRMMEAQGNFSLIQHEMKDSVSKLDDFLVRSEKISTTRNIWNTIFAVLSVLLGIIGMIGVVISLYAPNKDDMDDMIKKQMNMQYEKIDSLMDTKIILNPDSLKTIPFYQEDSITPKDQND